MDKNNKAIEFRRVLRWHRLGELQVAPRAQREFRQPWADHLLSTFDPDLFEPPHVSVRNGRKFIVDGQHRVWAISRWFGDGWEDQQIQCWTYETLTETTEARLFLYLGRGRKSIAASEDFRIALTAQEIVETDIDRIVRANGQTISKDPRLGISAHGTLKRVYLRDNPNSFGLMVRSLDRSHGIPAFRVPLIDGMGLVAQRYNGQIDEDRLITQLANVRGGVNGLLGDAQKVKAKMGTTLGQAMAATIVDVYNTASGPKLADRWKS